MALLMFVKTNHAIVIPQGTAEDQDLKKKSTTQLFLHTRERSLPNEKSVKVYNDIFGTHWNLCPNRWDISVLGKLVFDIDTCISGNRQVPVHTQASKSVMEDRTISGTVAAYSHTSGNR